MQIHPNEAEERQRNQTIHTQKKERRGGERRGEEKRGEREIQPPVPGQGAGSTAGGLTAKVMEPRSRPERSTGMIWCYQFLQMGRSLASEVLEFQKKDFLLFLFWIL